MIEAWGSGGAEWAARGPRGLFCLTGTPTATSGRTPPFAVRSCDAQDIVSAFNHSVRSGRRLVYTRNFRSSHQSRRRCRCRRNRSCTLRCRRSGTTTAAGPAGPRATTPTARPARRQRARREPVPKLLAAQKPRRAPMARLRPVSPVARGLKRGRAKESRAYQAARAEPSACPDNTSSLRGSARGTTSTHLSRRTRLRVRSDR